jgi:hypothetical protein
MSALRRAGRGASRRYARRAAAGPRGLGRRAGAAGHRGARTGPVLHREAAAAVAAALEGSSPPSRRRVGERAPADADRHTAVRVAATAGQSCSCTASRDSTGIMTGVASGLDLPGHGGRAGSAPRRTTLERSSEPRRPAGGWSVSMGAGWPSPRRRHPEAVGRPGVTLGGIAGQVAARAAATDRPACRARVGLAARWRRAGARRRPRCRLARARQAAIRRCTRHEPPPPSCRRTGATLHDRLAAVVAPPLSPAP